MCLHSNSNLRLECVSEFDVYAESEASDMPGVNVIVSEQCCLSEPAEAQESLMVAASPAHNVQSSNCAIKQFDTLTANRDGYITVAVCLSQLQLSSVC